MEIAKDLNETLEKIGNAGGIIKMPKTLISREKGYWALFMDTEGNQLALHSGEWTYPTTQSDEWASSQPRRMPNCPTLTVEGSFRSPMDSIFLAAFRSLSWCEPQQVQVQDLSFNFNSLKIYPQWEHIFDVGSNRPMYRIFLPCHSALYANMVLNLPHPTYAMARASFLFFIIPLMCRSSRQTVSKDRMISVLVLCR